MIKGCILGFCAGCTAPLNAAAEGLAECNIYGKTAPNSRNASWGRGMGESVDDSARDWADLVLAHLARCE